MRTHRNLCNLLSILLWRGVAIETILAKRNDDTYTRMDGTNEPANYYELATERYMGWGESDGDDCTFFLTYKAMGKEGLKCWFELCNTAPKITAHLYYLAANHNRISMETEVQEYAVLFEEIAGFQRENPPGAYCESIEHEILHVQESLEDFRELLPNQSNQAKVARDLACAYNSLKHTRESRRGKPREYWLDSLNLMNLCIVCHSIVLLWLAKTLGCRKEDISRIPKDNESTMKAFEFINKLDFEI